MSHDPGPTAHDEFRDLPDNPSIRHLKLQAKRRLAAGEFRTLHDAQLALAREHGMRSWPELKRHVAAAAAEECHALEQTRWVLQRYAGADAAGWIPPSLGELSEHFTELFLRVVRPETLAETLGSVAAELRQDLIPVEADTRRLRASIGGMRVEAVSEQTSPYRLAGLRIYPGGGIVTDPRAARPPVTSVGPVPEQVSGRIEESYAELGLVGVIAAGDRGDAPGAAAWAYARGWAGLERGVQLRPDHRFPAYAITKLVTSTAVLCLVARGAIGLDDPVGNGLRSLSLADGAVTVRELLSHTGGVDDPPSVWADSVADVASVFGTVVGCSGPRGEFAYSNGGYAVLGQLVADIVGSSFAEAATRLVLEPLGMLDSWFPDRTPSSDSPGSPGPVTGYRLTEDGIFEPEPPPTTFMLQAAGGLWCTAADLVRFGSTWHTLLPGELVEQALRPHAARDGSGQEIGLGWLLHYPNEVVGHAGAGQGRRPR